MPNIQIVTDSCAHFATPHFLHQYPMVTVVPNKINVAGKSYREGVDLSPEEGLRLLASQPYAPIVHSPTAVEFSEVYGRLSRHCDGIISIHASREIYSSYANAVAGTPTILANVSPASATNYYVRSENGDGCYSIKEITVTIQAPACGVITISGSN